MKISNKFFRIDYLHSGNTRLKWAILLVATILSITSIYYTHILVNKLKKSETAHVHLYARALEHMLNSEERNILFIAEEVIYKNHSVPTILTDEKDQFVFYENLDIDSLLSQGEKNKILRHELATMKNLYPPIEIVLKDPNTGEVFGKQFIYYKNSYLLTQLIVYPYIQFLILTIFGFISYLAFNYSKADEQNKLWIGLAKETAHQIGTPLSSLMAWVEALRDDCDIKDKEIVNELEKDVEKLLVVTERFSSIGSTPTLKEENICQVINTVKQYLQPRISSRIKIVVQASSQCIKVKMHAPLLEWVIETLCKNAVDAIGHAGTITIIIHEGDRDNVFVDITDTGKGIPKAIVTKIFKPGFTTKKYGWGLGLALAKRIVEQYHKGKIGIKVAGGNQGTTFRIEMKKIRIADEK